MTMFITLTEDDFDQRVPASSKSLQSVRKLGF